MNENNAHPARKVAVIGVLLAVRAVCGFFPLTIYFPSPLGPVKLFSLAHIMDGTCAMLFGPLAGVAFGFAGDFLGFLASQGVGGAYFPCYALSEIVTCVLFAVFLYKHEITWKRVITASLLNLLLVFIAMNSVWAYLFYGAGSTLALLPWRIGLNAAFTPVYIVILYFLLTRMRKLERHLR